MHSRPIASRPVCLSPTCVRAAALRSRSVLAHFFEIEARPARRAAGGRVRSPRQRRNTRERRSVCCDVGRRGARVAAGSRGVRWSGDAGIAAITWLVPLTVCRARLGTSTSAGPEALLRRAGDAHPIGRGRGSRCRCAVARAVAREGARWNTTARHHHLPHPLLALITRTGARGPRRRGHPRRLDRRAGGLEHVVRPCAHLSGLVATGADRVLAADAIELGVRR